MARLGLLLACCCWLAVARQVASSEVGEGLRKRLNETMSGSQVVKFSTVNATGLPYNSSTKFNPRGMGQLYNVTNMFIDLIQPKQAYPEGMIKLENGSFTFADPASEWRLLVRHYGGLAGLGLAGLLVAALLPCFGLFFCCCRCAGRCGARSQPFDKKHDHCRKVMLGVVLIGVATVLLFGVVCAYVTNGHMHQAGGKLPGAARTSLLDVRLYLATTKREVESVLKLNYAELETSLNGILKSSGRIVTDQLKESSRAVSLMSLNDIVMGLEPIRTDLRLMNEITRDLRNNASQLEILVRKVKKNLLQTLTECDTQDCKDLMHKHRISEMRINVDFDREMDRYFPKLPDFDVTNALNNITQLLDENIIAEVHKGMEQFMSIQKEIQQAVNQTIPEVSASIRRSGKSLDDVADRIARLIDRIDADIESNYLPKLDLAQRHIDQYSPYRYYLGLAISSVLLAVLACISFGLLCGICGKRPDGYGDDCCNKGSGARFLMMAVWMIFLLASILMIVTIVHMIVGVVAERAICEPLKNPNDNRMFELVDEYVQIKKILYPNNPRADINMSHILNSCHRNESIYDVLKLEYVINVNSLKSYIDRYDINQTIHQLEAKISLSRNYKIISQSARDKLDALAQSGLSDIKFYQYTENLKDNITNVNLEHLASQLHDLATKLPKQYQEIKHDLLKNAFDLEVYHREIVVPMSNLSNQLSERAAELQEHIKFNHSSMADAIQSLVKEVNKAQEFITKRGPEHVKTLAAEFGKAFIFQVNNYLDYVRHQALNFGKCGPVSNAYNATLVAGCNKILDPFNGFWASVGWCLILFLPTIILCVKLSTLYQKSDPYPGPLVEAEYLYDAYADRDNVPLAHRHHHHPGGGYPESYDGSAVGYSDHERIADARQGSSHHDSRYSDHAPNSDSRNQAKKVSFTAKKAAPDKVFCISNGNEQNWDFPNGGPPRYQPAAVAPPLSTEYERPPPYYYPGPGDRN